MQSGSDSLNKRMDSRDRKLEDSECQLNSLPEWGSEIWQLRRKVIDLEDRVWTDDTHLYEVLEDVEKGNMTAFLKDLLQTS